MSPEQDPEPPPPPAADRTADRPAVTLEGGAARIVVGLLELLADLPSTPREIRDEARERAFELGAAMPSPPKRPAAGGRLPMASVTIDVVAATGVAGLLELLAEMPSTPPDVATDARHHAQSVWAVASPPSEGGAA